MMVPSSNTSIGGGTNREINGDRGTEIIVGSGSGATGQRQSLNQLLSEPYRLHTINKFQPPHPTTTPTATTTTHHLTPRQIHTTNGTTPRSSPPPTATPQWATSQVPVNRIFKKQYPTPTTIPNAANTSSIPHQQHHQHRSTIDTKSNGRKHPVALPIKDLSSNQSQDETNLLRRAKDQRSARYLTSDQQQAANSKRSTVTLVSAKDEWKVELSLDLVQPSSAICSMLHGGGGSFVESVRGEIRFPTIRAIILQEVVRFLNQLSQAQHEQRELLFHPFAPSTPESPPSVSLLIELLMTAHFLDLPQLMHECARTLANKFLEFPPLRHFPDDVLQILIDHLPPHLLFIAEKKLWKQHRQSDNRTNIHTRLLWHQLFEKRFRVSPPSTLFARSLLIQFHLERMIAHYHPPISSHPSNEPFQSSPIQLTTPIESLALISPRFKPTPTTTISNIPPAPSTLTIQTDSNWIELKNMISFLGSDLQSFQLRNSLIENDLADILAFLPQLTSLDLSIGGYSKQVGLQLARGLKSMTHTLIGLDLSHCGLTSEGIGSLTRMMLEHQLQQQKRRKTQIDGNGEEIKEFQTTTDEISFRSNPKPISSTSAASIVPPLLFPSIGAKLNLDPPKKSRTSRADKSTRHSNTNEPTQPNLGQTKSVSNSSTALHLTLPNHTNSKDGHTPCETERLPISDLRSPRDLFLPQLQRSISLAILKHQKKFAEPSKRNEIEQQKSADQCVSNLPELSARLMPSASSTSLTSPRFSPPLPHPSIGLEISLRDNLLGDGGLLSFAQTLHTSYIQYLDLSDNLLGEKGAIILAGYFRRTNSITHLNVANCQLGNRGIGILIESLLPYSPASTAAHILTTNDYLSPTYAATSQLTSISTALNLLDLRGNLKPGEENYATGRLADWFSQLSVGSQLTSLSLKDNHWSEGPFVSLIPKMSQLHHLEQLDCSGLDLSLSDTIPSIFCQTFLELSELGRLHSISFAHDRMSTHAMNEFAALLTMNPVTLTALDLNGNSVDAYTAAAFGQALSKNTHLRSLGLSGFIDGPRMRSEGCLALMRGLAHQNQTLTSLDLSRHGLRDVGCVAVAQTMTASALRFISLQRNHIQAEGARQLEQTMKQLAVEQQPTDQRTPTTTSSTSTIHTPHTHIVCVIDLMYNYLDTDSIQRLQRTKQQLTQSTTPLTTTTRGKETTTERKTTKDTNHQPSQVQSNGWHESLTTTSSTSAFFHPDQFWHNGSNWIHEPETHFQIHSHKLSPFTIQQLRQAKCELKHKARIQILTDHQHQPTPLSTLE